MSLDALYIGIRAPADLAGVPSQEDIVADGVKFFCASDDPTDVRRINSAGTAYVAIGQGASVSQTIDALSLLGTNSTVAYEYNRAEYLNNRGQQAHMPVGVTNSQRDANGWPLVGGTWKITSNYNSVADGQLDPAITYHCYYTIDPSNPTHATPGTGMTAGSLNIIGTPTVRSDGVTTDFVMTVPSLVNGTLTFDGGITYLSIPTDGVTDPRGGPEFDQNCLAHHAKFATVRLMDLLAVIGNPQVTWASRTVDFGPSSPGGFSNERLARFINAIAAYPGSRLRYVWWNIPAKVNDDYVTQLSLVLKTLLNPSIKLIPEDGNEPWNSSGEDDYLQNYLVAIAACQVATTFGTTANGTITLANIAAQTSDGTTVTVTMGSGFNGSASGGSLNVAGFGTGAPLAIGQTIYHGGVSTGVTITGYGTGTGGAGTYTLSGTISFANGTAFQAVGGSLPSYVVTGAQMFCYIDGGTNWATGSLAHPTSITVSGSSFTYTANTANGEASVPAAGTAMSSAATYYFNLASPLLASGISNSQYSLSLKQHILRSFQMSLLWKANRPNDWWILNMQFVSFAAGAADNVAAFPPFFLPYADWLGKNLAGGGGASGWLKALAVAPYTTTSASFTSAPQNTVGPSVIHGVPWAPYAQVGSTVRIHGVGTTTVAAGSSGTDLMIAAAVPTAITPSSQNSIALVASVDPTGAEVCNFLIYQGLPTMEATIRACQYNARQYGLSLFAYEIGPDTSTFPTGGWASMQQAIHSNPLMGVFVGKLLSTWFNAGGGLANYFSAVPDNLLNVTNGAWGAMTSWLDTTSQKIAAILAKFGQTRVLGNHYGSTASGPVVLPGDYTTKIGGGGAVKTLTSIPAGGTSTGSVYWFTNTQLRYSDWTFTAHQNGNYRIDVWLSEGTTSSPGLAGVFMDGAQVGTAQAVAGTGSGTSAGAVPQLVASLTVALTLDYHNLSVQFAPNVGSSPGIYQVVVTAI